MRLPPVRWGAHRHVHPQPASRSEAVVDRQFGIVLGMQISLPGPCPLFAACRFRSGRMPGIAGMPWPRGC